MIGTLMKLTNSDIYSLSIGCLLILLMLQGNKTACNVVVDMLTMV